MPRRVYGHKKSVVEESDPIRKFTVSRVQTGVKKVDLRHLCPPVYDQGELGSCTANALAGAYQFDEIKEKEKSEFQPSRLYIYYNERAKDGDVNEDAGSTIKTGIQVINTQGVCPETKEGSEPCWPYDTSKFTEKPTQDCYNFGKTHHSVKYHRINQNLEQLKQCLIEGYPIAFGFTVFSSFESQQVADTGVMPMPQPSEQIMGGHAVLAVGFDDDKKVFIVRNSWGPDWGDKGYFYMPYEYMTNPELASDFWSITLVQDQP